jgi:metallophosphoesterase (TIGR00282 family)
MRILFFGDIVAKPGRKAVTTSLPKLREEFTPDFVFGNVENLSHGLGVTPNALQELLDAKFDGFTSGNHIYDKDAVFELFQNSSLPLLRPYNMPHEKVPGHNILELQHGSRKLLIMNFMGTAFFQEPYENPFTKIPEVLEKYKDERLAGIIIDFHAEATAEKRALGFYLDGKVSAVLGTHTHVQTNDAQILENGTAYITDIGMLGTSNSIIGASKSTLEKTYVGGNPFRYEVEEEGPSEIAFVIIDIDPETQKATKIVSHKRPVQ